MHLSWQQLLEPSKGLLDGIEKEIMGIENLSPKRPQVMRAFELPVEKVRLLLLGQDPYPTKGMACGLAFANAPGTATPQSLKNLMKELQSDLPVVSASADLTRWTNQGVLSLHSPFSARMPAPLSPTL